MSRSIQRAVLVLVALSLAPQSHAGVWSLGTHFGASAVDIDKSRGSTGVWALPSNVLVYQPGLRLSYGDSHHVHDLQVDMGMLVIDEAGSVLSLIAGSLNYQHVFMGDRSVAPLANATFGFLRESAAARTSTAASYGLGAGVRRLVHADHGAVRAELRWDHLDRERSIGRPSLDTFGVRMGFDLWL